MNDFVAGLSARCKTILASVPRCNTEEATKQFLVLPFLNLLGYNVFDPNEVVPEHHADFSDKYKNRVDYAIMRDSQPIIAIEAKAAGAELRDARGQLRSYFNACRSIRVGMLTNGVLYECYADTEEQNIMDDTPFLAFDLTEIAEGRGDARALQGIDELRRERFDPGNIGTEARLKLLLTQFINRLDEWAKTPSDGLVRLMLDETGHKGNKTTKVVDDFRGIVQQAFALHVERAILRRIGLRAEDNRVEATPVPAQPMVAAAPVNDGIVTTETELRVFSYATRRLAFLVKDEALYHEIDGIQYKDMKTTFRVFHRSPNAGGLFLFRELADGVYHFTFPALENKVIETRNLTEIDDALVQSFRLRAASAIAKGSKGGDQPAK